MEFFYVLCVNRGEDDHSLILGKIYKATVDEYTDETGRIRVWDEEGEDYLYPQEQFKKIDLPQDVIEELARNGYFEEAA